MREDQEKRKTINLFMDDEMDYFGEVEVLHLLSFIRDTIGWETLRKKVKNPLEGLHVVSYYGCTLQRPRSVAIEAPGSFELMRHFMEALGATVLDFPSADQCCGSYQAVTNPEAGKRAAANVLNWADRVGAEALVLSCPLCEFNLGKQQGTLLREEKVQKMVPTFYFSQLLAVALGLPSETCRFELNGKGCLDLLKGKGVL
jgi:heterodisulfide reductase subunit B